MSSLIGVVGFCGPGWGRGCSVFYPASVLLSLYLGLCSYVLASRERMQRVSAGDLFSLGLTRFHTVPAGTRVRQVLLQLLYMDSHQVV